MTRPLLIGGAPIKLAGLPALAPPRPVYAIGDSTTEANTGWPERLRALTDPLYARGGDGIHMLSRDEWTATTAGNAPTQATTSDAWDRAPFCGAFGTPKASAYLFNGSAKIFTWTKPGGLTVTKFYLTFVDGSSPGTPSVSIDGGTYFNCVDAVFSGSNALKRVLIDVPVTSTLQVRGANAAGTAGNVYLAWGEPASNGPLIVHNMGASSESLAVTVRTTSGDWDAWMSIMPPGITCPMFTNDIDFVGPVYGGDVAAFLTAWEAKIGTVIDSLQAAGHRVLWLNFFEQSGRDTTTQAGMRSSVKTVCATKGASVLDLYDLVGDYTTANAAGYMADTLHPSTTGQQLIASQVWRRIQAWL